MKLKHHRGEVSISQCSKDLQEVRQLQKDMVIRMEKLWIKNIEGEINGN